MKKKQVTIDKYDYAIFRRVVLLLRSINHPLRKQIIELLKTDSKLTVTDIYIKLRLEQSVASQHLAILRRAGVVVTERSGKFIYYSLDTNKYELIQKHQQYKAVARALAHKLRIDIYKFVEQHSPNVNKIYGAMKLEQSITSQHLKMMRDCELVIAERSGKFIFYKVKNIDNLINVFNEFVENIER